MANNYTQATVSPSIPASAITPLELELLNYMGLTGDKYTHEGTELYYFYAEEYLSTVDDCFELDICGDTEIDPDDAVYLEDGKVISGIESCDVFQNILKRLPVDEFPHITIQGADTCSKMRADNFGGFAVYITRESIEFCSTWAWLNEKTSQK